jgi:zinc protease
MGYATGMIRLLVLTLLFIAPLAQAVEIQKITASNGLTAWLVEDHTLPMVRADFSFRAGSAFVIPGQEGVAALTVDSLLEGAGTYDATAFKEELAKIGANLSSSADKLNAGLSLTTLADHKERAFALAGLALTAPRFSADAVERVKQQQLAALKRQQESPKAVAEQKFYNALFYRHPYSHPVLGYERSVWRLNEKKASQFYLRNFTSANLRISVVGAVTADELKTMLETYFDRLPQDTLRNKVTRPVPDVFPSLMKVERAVPQAALMLGHVGLSRDAEDYYAAYVLNYILGGGGFNARLMEEVREKRGLTYGIYSTFDPLPVAGPWYVSVETEPKNIAEVEHLVETAMATMRQQHVPAQELEHAKAFLIDSFPLRVDSSAKLLGYLRVMQQEELGADYLEKWPEHIRAVTAEDVLHAAQRYLHPDSLLKVRVGPTHE